MGTSWMRKIGVTAGVAAAIVAWHARAARALSDDSGDLCAKYSFLCAENQYATYDGKYIGHDEPAVLFYSNTSGAGNNNVYRLTLPKDPPTLPTQTGGGTFNFELHPAFWFGMAMCDTQSYPEFT